MQPDHSQLAVTPRIAIPLSELEFTAILASGPGGQNVNKVATAVQLRFDAAHSPSLPEDVRARLLKLGGQRLTKAGEIVITARRFRTQERNRQDALERLAELIQRAAHRPKPRIGTKPTRASKERRLQSKRQQTERKAGRRKVEY